MKGGENIHVGTSGWHYGHWTGPFYPENLTKKEFLPYYAEHFHTVEVNSTFYGLPQKKTLLTWQKSVPEGFLFAVKSSRYITHMKKLKDAEKALYSLLKRVSVLGDNLGPILFQLPPGWRYNAKRFRNFLDLLPKGYRYAFEFRDRTWQNPEVYETMEYFNAAFCIYHLDGFLSPKIITADFIYVRLHGPDGPYRGNYGVQTLSGWSGAFSTWSSGKKKIFCYFDNDEAGYAPRNALRLQKMIAK